MTPIASPTPGRKIRYPESDGEPIAENTLQFKWIFTLFGGVDTLFADDPNVFVAGDLLWYPIEGDNVTRIAPDVMVAFGRPKGERGSYRQWEESGIAPQVVIEVLSPGNRAGEMIRKFQFYERCGVEEYYIYDPDRITLEGFLRREGVLKEIPEMNGWVSPRLTIRFDMSGEDLVVYRPDGRRFLNHRELAADRDAQFRFAEEERQARLQAQQRADQAQQRADQAQQRADQAQQRADQALQQATRLAEQLRKLGIEPETK